MKIIALFASHGGLWEEAFLVAAIDEYTMDGGGWFSDKELSEPNLRYVEIEVPEKPLAALYDMPTIKAAGVREIEVEE